MSTEEWHPIPGQPNYFISREGRVLSTKRRQPYVLQPVPDKRGGYLQVSLWTDRQRVKSVHRLVAEVFLGPRPSGMVIRHLDGNNLNNRADNLAYGTPAENSADQRRHGTHGNTRKTHCANGHLFDEENTYRLGGKRACRPCNAAAARRYKDRKQAAA